ncbi:hypothetical protein OIU84_011614 [Salix udensis]|uniref:Major facilitator superfamily (MFS) profile domain-containing protein n=1 Tax=Salix udensis TaxID=889485 RepID=A0AAD6JQG7_9ROSI|nr:hypothetical protein OIU84_011614 [Salix udensis]
MSIASLITFFSTNVWIYYAFRFLSGLGSASAGASALVLCTEKVGSKWRGQMGSIAGISCFRDIIVARNTALSIVRQELVLGAVSSPVLISAGRSYLGSVMREFGLVILYCSVFAFCLPEIRGVTLCDTMDEHKEKDQLAM